MTELEEAVEVFVTALARIKSRTHPYLVTRIGELFVLADAPGKKEPRKTEVVSCNRGSSETVECLRNSDVGWHFLCDIIPTSEDLSARRDEYKRLGYRAISTEWMYVHDLDRVPSFDSDPPVRLVLSQMDADAIPQLAHHRLRVVPGAQDFMIWNSIRDFGRVRSVEVGEDRWVQDLYVHADVRCRGFGKALMSALLRHDRSVGARRSVLLASKAGARIYPRLGYREIGTLQLFCPRTR